MSNRSELLLFSMGDPCGIGPELIWKLWLTNPSEIGPCGVVGHPGAMARAAAAVGAHGYPMHTVTTVAEAASYWEATRQVAPGMPLVVVAVEAEAPLPAWSVVSGDAGRLAARSIETAAKACLRGEAVALVTAPIQKQALSLAGWRVPGHTELLQSLAAEHLGLSTRDLPVRMMLANPELQTVLHSIHVPLREALDAITVESVLDTLRLTVGHVPSHGDRPLRVAVAGVNPHAGEGGLFGREEVEVLAPALALAAQQGWQVSGPHAPDTVFMRARQGEFDVVVAMYHDQGLIPVKYLGVEHGVNVTLGLPFIRTSPDHGTAFDLAGQGKADPQSLREAVLWARRAAVSRSRSNE
jgi:4-hydroxythreonine-4-phosphate dehydrogenase